MKKCILLFAVSLLAMGLSSCDEGRIYENQIVNTGTEGRTLKVVGKISGLSKWPDSYSVVVAGFDNKSGYAVISKPLPANLADGSDLQLVVSGISEEVTDIKLCAINRLRESVVDFQVLEEDARPVNDTLIMDIGTVDLSMYHTIQTHVFDISCIGCHGSSTAAAGGLFLTGGKSYDALVNKASSIDGDMLLVKSGSAQESFLHVVLNANGSTHHDHVDILSAKPYMLNLIDNWIEDGAKQ